LDELLKMNDTNHDMFFNDQGFHNHMDHHLFAVYSLGGDSERLKEIYNQHTSYLISRTPLHSPSITKENFTQHLSNRAYWTDYQAFFQKELESSTPEKILNEYLWRPDMLHRLESGAIHPLIHIGYGLEFNNPLILSEGLAMCAVTSTLLRPVIEPQIQLRSEQSHQPKRKTLKEIYEEILQDDRFSDLNKFADENRLEDFFKRQGAKVLNEYLSQIQVEPTEEDIKKRFAELYELTAMAYAAITPPGKTPKFDFFIMHGLTSIYFLPHYFKHISYEHATLLLRMHCATVITYWVVTGRPKIYLENLLSYTTVQEDNRNPWLRIKEAALTTKDEHQCKALRSLMWANGHLGDSNGLWLKAAQATIDHVKGVPGSTANQYWAFEKLGYEEGWGYEKQ
jgi:hypothetical protein